MKDRQTCAHESFEGNNAVHRLEDTGQFMVDGLEARLAIAPQGSIPHPLAGVRGFTVKTPKQGLDS